MFPMLKNSRVHLTKLTLLLVACFGCKPGESSARRRPCPEVEVVEVVPEDVPIYSEWVGDRRISGYFHPSTSHRISHDRPSWKLSSRISFARSIPDPFERLPRRPKDSGIERKAQHAQSRAGRQTRHAARQSEGDQPKNWTTPQTGSRGESGVALSPRRRVVSGT